jgi:hypothetical protein
MDRQSLKVTKGLKNTQPQTILSWGLGYRSVRQTTHLEVLRFDSHSKMVSFRKLFGDTCGFGVRKKRPRFSDGTSVLCMNDAINAVYFPSYTPIPGNAVQEHDTSADQMNVDSTWRSFRNGVVEDGIDLAYDVDVGILQVVVRYRKVIVSNSADDGMLACLQGVGVCFGSDDNNAVWSHRSSDELLESILPGAEFVDHSFVMRVVSADNSTSEIRARKVYKIRHDGTTVRSTDMTIVIYNDINYVSTKIRERILEE